MSYHEKQNIVSIISTLLIFGLYSLYVYQVRLAADINLVNDFSFWGSVILILIPVSIVAKIIIYIVFDIIYTITAHEGAPAFSDERDQLIQLKATRNSLYIFMFGFLLAMGSQAVHMPPFVMFVTLVVCGLVSEIVADISMIYFYQRGV
jgi:hypothetical protein